MFLRVATMAALLAAPLYAQAPATNALPDAREIINRHIQAVGGREAILAHQSMHATGTLSVASAGISGPMEIFGAANPNRVIVKTSVPGIGDIMEGFDGSHGWSMSPMTGPMLKVGKELSQVKLDADFYSELRDPKTYPDVKTLEKTTFDGRPCYKVSLKRIDGIEDFDFYDAATGLRAGSINTRETPNGVLTMTSIEGNYKKIGTLTQAMLVTQQVMGIEQKITLSTVEYDNVDASAFEPPAAIKALIK
jgi:Flp pilus assembly protein TadG